jgi:hypothetical protein
MLFDFVPKLLVELGGISRPCGVVAELQMVSRLTRREEGREKGCFGQQHELVPMPHDFELLEDLS